MMGAIYLDQGYDFTNRLLINKIFAHYLKLDTLVEAETDFKSRLIEWCQKNHHTILFTTNYDKNYSSSHPFFYSKVLIDNIEVGYGAGESKKEAEQRAAYSVSQGFNDADCNKLMDHLDNFEGSGKSKNDTTANEPKQPKENKPRRNAKRKTEEVKEVVKEEANIELAIAEDNAPKEEVTEAVAKESKPKRTRARRSSKPKAEAAAAENTSAEEVTAPENVADNTPSAEQTEKPKPRTRRRRAPKAQTDTAENTTNTTPAE